jgi:F-type H+-transporting ATPase subunit delta
VSLEAVAKRYAQALFELGSEGSNVAGLTEDIKKIASAYQASAELRSAVDNPLVSESQRLAVMKELADKLALSPTAKNAIGFITTRRRIAALPLIAKELARMSDERSGIVRATVTSAAPLSETYFQKLQREVERLTGKKVLLERKQDPSLIAGVVVRIGDRVIDGSAKARLEQVRQQLTQS